MSRFSMTMVPRDPDKAVDFLVEFLIQNRKYYYSSSGLNKTRSGEAFEVMEVLGVAANRSSFSESVKEQVGRFSRVYDNFTSADADRYFQDLARTIRISRIHEHFGKLTPEPIFSLDQDEISRINKLASEMKLIVNESDFFSDHHKGRLVRRISQVEEEIHKKEGRFDVILGGVVDFGDALGQFGKKVKPLVDRMKEIRVIVQTNSREYEKLPAPDEVKRLPAPDQVPSDIESE
jgi:hypothetical protein